MDELRRLIGHAMVFSSHIFVFYFLPLVLAVYFLLPAKHAWRNAWLLVSSYVFYAWWSPKFVLLMLAVTLATYFCGLLIGSARTTGKSRRCALVAGVTFCLGTLSVFKYLGFFQESFNEILGTLGIVQTGVWKIVLPVGISFYVFQAITYVVDVYRGKVPAARSLTDYACYIALFPQLVAGPIIHYKSVAGELRERRVTADLFASGTALFILGFAKKILIANPLGESADLAFGAQWLGAGTAWFGLGAYMFQIYFDFCGYSDMAVGLGRMFGFGFIKNFNDPYRAKGMSDFWRRWHISLSGFLRDYLYIPLGGNRGGTFRTHANLAFVMLLGGLWHGADWTFIVWGAWHGALLIAERMVVSKFPRMRIPRGLAVVLTFLAVALSWVWFRSESLGDALAYFRAMAGGAVENQASHFLASRLYTPSSLAVTIAAIVITFLPHQAHDWTSRLTWRKVLVLPPAFALALFSMFSQGANPFLYFQF